MAGGKKHGEGGQDVRFLGLLKKRGGGGRNTKSIYDITQYSQTPHK